MNFNLISLLSPTFALFRDDLFPFLGGGNKGRKMVSIAKDIEQQQCNALVTTGGIQSNHCRAVAVYAAIHGFKCTLILHGNKERFYTESGNAKVMRLSGSEIVFAEDANQIGSLMDQAIKCYSAEGFKPYYIWGGGHNMAGGSAYIEAVEELAKYSYKNNWTPDYIFLASGTGSTHAGILAGLDKIGFKKTEVIGISVARNKDNAEKIVAQFYEELCAYNNIVSLQRNTIVLDDYLCGGYEKFNEELEYLSLNSIKNYGFILDTTYSGKAFYGMKKHIGNHKIKGNILFWHTGGILNFFA